MATKADEARFRRALAASTDKYVKQQARNTIAENAQRDAACEGYARIPGPEACDFCITMGAHDHFYRTRETAGGGSGHGSKDDRYHPYCNCEICMVFRKRGKLVARDPETGEPVPYDGAEMVKRYREAGSPTFKKNRAAENARRRGERRSGKAGTGAGKASQRQNNYAGAKLADAEFEAFKAELADAATADELRAAAKRVERAWRPNANGRYKPQWDEMRRYARELEFSFKPMPASTIYLNRSTEFYERMSKVKPLPDYQDFGIHGDQDGYAFAYTDASGEDIGKWTQVSVREFAAMILSNPDYRGGPIRLLACSTGKHPDGAAQQLANYLGVEVLAPNKDLYIFDDGTYNLASSEWESKMIKKGELRETGKWIPFIPKPI